MSEAIADLGQVGRSLHLTFLYLACEQRDVMRRVLMHNGNDSLYHTRATAKAHLDQWDASRGLVSMHLFGDDPSEFLTELERIIGVAIPTECNPEYQRMD